MVGVPAQKNFDKNRRTKSLFEGTKKEGRSKCDKENII